MEVLNRGIVARRVQSSVEVSAEPEVCWRFLTQPTLRAEWFADSCPSGGANTVDLQFGDGDFFRVATVAAEEPTRLCWVWRFLGVGSLSEIEFLLTKREIGTELRVRDRGQYSESGVDELEDGWADFLSRLRQRIETGKNTRYQWSETFGASIVVRADPATLSRVLRDPQLWNGFFPETEITLDAGNEGIHLEFRRPQWGGISTHARISLSDGETGLNLSVTHDGWLRLPESCRIAERRNAAGCWAHALRTLESALAQ